MWTMTQGHEPHGDGGGREKLLIKACGISYSYHRTNSVLPPMAATYHTATITPSGNAEQREGGDEGEPGVKFTWEGLSLKPTAVQFGHLGVPTNFSAFT